MRASCRGGCLPAACQGSGEDGGRLVALLSLIPPTRPNDEALRHPRPRHYGPHREEGRLRLARHRRLEYYFSDPADRLNRTPPGDVFVRGRAGHRRPHGNALGGVLESLRASRPGRRHRRRGRARRIATEAGFDEAHGAAIAPGPSRPCGPSTAMRTRPWLRSGPRFGLQPRRLVDGRHLDDNARFPPPWPRRQDVVTWTAGREAAAKAKWTQLHARLEGWVQDR